MTLCIQHLTLCFVVCYHVATATSNCLAGCSSSNPILADSRAIDMANIFDFTSARNDTNLIYLISASSLSKVKLSQGTQDLTPIIVADASSFGVALPSTKLRFQLEAVEDDLLVLVDVAGYKSRLISYNLTTGQWSMYQTALDASHPTSVNTTYLLSKVLLDYTLQISAMDTAGHLLVLTRTYSGQSQLLVVSLTSQTVYVVTELSSDNLYYISGNRLASMTMNYQCDTGFTYLESIVNLVNGSTPMLTGGIHYQLGIAASSSQLKGACPQKYTDFASVQQYVFACNSEDQESYFISLQLETHDSISGGWYIACNKIKLAQPGVLFGLADENHILVVVDVASLLGSDSTSASGVTSIQTTPPSSPNLIHRSSMSSQQPLTSITSPRAAMTTSFTPVTSLFFDSSPWVTSPHMTTFSQSDSSASKLLTTSISTSSGRNNPSFTTTPSSSSSSNGAIVSSTSSAAPKETTTKSASSTSTQSAKQKKQKVTAKKQKNDSHTNVAFYPQTPALCSRMVSFTSHQFASSAGDSGAQICAYMCTKSQPCFCFHWDIAKSLCSLYTHEEFSTAQAYVTPGLYDLANLQCYCY